MGRVVKPKRKRATSHQVHRLNEVFARTFFPSSELRLSLALDLGMTPRTVQIWFQNKRQGWRSEHNKSIPRNMNREISELKAAQEAAAKEEQEENSRHGYVKSKETKDEEEEEEDEEEVDDSHNIPPTKPTSDTKDGIKISEITEEFRPQKLEEPQAPQQTDANDNVKLEFNTEMSVDVTAKLPRQEEREVRKGDVKGMKTKTQDNQPEESLAHSL
jgi:cytoskeletal protein RodZ